MFTVTVCMSYKLSRVCLLVTLASYRGKRVVCHSYTEPFLLENLNFGFFELGCL